MSADNGWILQLRESDNKYALQHYLASSDELPNPEHSGLVFRTIEAAVLHFAQMQETTNYPCEYGLMTRILPKKVEDDELKQQMIELITLFMGQVDGMHKHKVERLAVQSISLIRHYDKTRLGEDK